MKAGRRLLSLRPASLTTRVTVLVTLSAAVAITVALTLLEALADWPGVRRDAQQEDENS